MHMKRLSFQDRLRKSFTKYISIIIAAVFFMFVGVIFASFATGVVGSGRESVQRLSKEFVTQRRSYRKALNCFSLEPTMKDALAGNDASARASANRLLYEFSNDQAYKPYFVLMRVTGEVICSNFNQSNQESFSASTFAKSACLRMDEASSEILSFVCTAPLTSGQACSYTLCCAITGKNGEKNGYLFFNLREEGFRKKSRVVSQEILIADLYDNIIFTTLDMEKDPEDKLPFGRLSFDVEDGGIISLNKETFFICACPAREEELCFYTLTPLGTRLQTMAIGGFAFLLMMILLFAVVDGITRIFAKQNAKEIRELTQAVVALNLECETYSLSPQCSEEANGLFEQFRKITLHLRETNRHNEELRELRRQMEVKQLEEQFNPHFVFNVMETVRYQIGEDPQAASEMLQSFAMLMRYSINTGNTEIQLESDVEYVNDYLLIQKVRYNNCLNYEFRIPDELMECRVPKLLLQPLVENSIKHGFRQDRTLHIRIEAKRIGQDISISVSDNGKGMKAEQLDEIIKSLYLKQNDPQITHIGLYNVHRILGLLYGEKYGISVQSEWDKGTMVTIKIPYVTSEESFTV